MSLILKESQQENLWVSEFWKDAVAALAHLLNINWCYAIAKKKKKLNIVNWHNYAEEIRDDLSLCLVVVKPSKINQIKINLCLGKGVDRMTSL